MAGFITIEDTTREVEIEIIPSPGSGQRIVIYSIHMANIAPINPFECQFSFDDGNVSAGSAVIGGTGIAANADIRFAKGIQGPINKKFAVLSHDISGGLFPTIPDIKYLVEYDIEVI